MELVGVPLGVWGPFDAPGLFAFLAARAIDGVERAGIDDDGTLRFARTMRLPGGPAAFEITAAAVGATGAETNACSWELRLSLELASSDDEAEAINRVRRLLDLNADLARIDEVLAADPALAPLVATVPGIRALGVVEPHEYVIRAIVGQQITVAAARTHLNRLTVRLGQPYLNSAFSGLTSLFPTMAAIANEVPMTEPGTLEASDPERPLRLPARVVAAVVGAARALADGTLIVAANAEAQTLRESLTTLPGVGPWTAEYLALRLGDQDAWPIGDVALLAGAAAAGIAPPLDLSPGRRHRLLAERAKAWAPYRSYAALHLWRAALEL
ncbi:MAG: hypothetical protein FWD83_01680 [Promicromonosporaceae bacterium]|nr:hypothetical protein [Promicromonosporaceae bacterium]